MGLPLFILGAGSVKTMPFTLSLSTENSQRGMVSLLAAEDDAVSSTQRKPSATSKIPGWILRWPWSQASSPQNPL